MLIDLTELLKLFLTLGGFAALVAVVIDWLKHFGLPDGSAPTANLILNLIGFVLFVVANVFGFNVAGVDKLLSSVASVLVALLGLIGQFVISRGVHNGLKEVPLLSYSHPKG